ncbi:hypothetical protein BD410DRAFT_713917 [Rickenella mellea]|uniref:Protein CMS1 n=1 Tax=Rickenella mellea TaxID=50990 RepID=A0A4Y7QJF3_9AGAM|nr:hypothetical protein BD410DRAFT_713917 [Rickenella mellea]
MNKGGGDDLEDDFIPDDLVELSEEDLDDDLDSKSLSSPDDLEFNTTAGATSNKDEVKLEKKRKRRQKEKERKTKRLKIVNELASTEPASIAAQPPSEIAVYLSTMQAKTFSKMSAMELDDIRIPESNVADTTLWTAPRTLDQLGDFVAKVLPTLRTRLSQKSKSLGAPTLLFLTGAAMRVVDVTRILKDKAIRGEKGGEVAKLFAKHVKLEEHINYLRRTKVGAAVGTPGRIGKLLQAPNALSISALTHIILDVSFRDTKKRSLLDIPEVRDEVFKTVLGDANVQEARRQGKIQIVLF